MLEKKALQRLAVALAVGLLTSQFALAENQNQVYYRYGKATSKKNRGKQVFTDTAGLIGKNDDTSGFTIGAGLDLSMYTGVGPGDLLGEINVDYSQFSRRRVRQATSQLLGGSNNTDVTVSELGVAVSPKYRFSFLDGQLRPWIIPAGLVFLVNSPPSDDTTYLDVGYHLGAGLEYRFVPQVSVGLDYRYTIAFSQPGINSSYGSYALYLGLNF